MARPRKNANNEELLRAALDGLEMQRNRVEEQIMQVRSLLNGAPRRRGRPPSRTNAAASVGPRKRRTMSLAARKRIAAAQKRRWAEYRKAESAGAAS